RVVWQRPRFEGAGKAPLLLEDYAHFGAAYEVDHSAVFADTATYLAAALAGAHDKKLSVKQLAQENKLDPALLKRWVTVLALDPLNKETVEAGKSVPAVTLDLPYRDVVASSLTGIGAFLTMKSTTDFGSFGESGKCPSPA